MHGLFFMQVCNVLKFVGAWENSGLHDFFIKSDEGRIQNGFQYGDKKVSADEPPTGLISWNTAARSTST
jgi:hypothetical protein